MGVAPMYGWRQVHFRMQFLLLIKNWRIYSRFRSRFRAMRGGWFVRLNGCGDDVRLQSRNPSPSVPFRNSTHLSALLLTGTQKKANPVLKSIPNPASMRPRSLAFPPTP